jgi:hypothetical protein
MSKLYRNINLSDQDDMIDADYVYQEWMKDNFFNPVFEFAREHYFDKYEIDYCIELRDILSGKDSELLKHITVEEAELQFNEKMTHILSVSIISSNLKNKKNGR